MLSNDFYQAVIDNDDRGLSRAIERLFPSLVAYLKATMGCCDDDCQESVQLTLIQTINRIKIGEIREPSCLKSYMKTTAKNNLLRAVKKGPIEVFDESASYSVVAENQAENLINSDSHRILTECLNKLDPYNRAFIDYWIQYPGIGHEEVAEAFGLSVNATWQRKYRLVRLLHKCAKKNDL
jgi:DNA-directed RNA polymerase specialized sigma24 family protein